MESDWADDASATPAKQHASQAAWHEGLRDERDGGGRIMGSGTRDKTGS
jgi:hypothetical protein